MPLSYSQLQTYRRCPKQYDFAFVKKIGRPMSPGESFGASIHNTLKRFGELEMQLGTKNEHPLTLFTDDTTHDVGSELTATTLTTMWRQCFIAEGYGSRSEMDVKLKQGEESLKHYFEWWAKRPRNVVGIEKSFKCSVGKGRTIAGRFDRVERGDRGLIIIDFKSSQPRSQGDIDADLQLSVYALAAQETWNEPVESLSLLFLGASGITEFTTRRSEAELETARAKIMTLAERIDAKDFTATPETEKCRHCPYRTICPFRAV